MNTPRRQGDSEEPELGSEESVPLDGKDPIGEQMIDELGRNLDKGSQNDKGTKEETPPMPEQFPAS